MPPTAESAKAAVAESAPVPAVAGPAPSGVAQEVPAVEKVKKLGQKLEQARGEILSALSPEEKEHIAGELTAGFDRLRSCLANLSFGTAAVAGKVTAAGAEEAKTTNTEMEPKEEKPEEMETASAAQSKDKKTGKSPKKKGEKKEKKAKKRERERARNESLQQEREQQQREQEELEKKERKEKEQEQKEDVQKARELKERAQKREEEKEQAQKKREEKERQAKERERKVREESAPEQEKRPPLSGSVAEQVQKKREEKERQAKEREQAQSARGGALSGSVADARHEDARIGEAQNDLSDSEYYSDGGASDSDGGGWHRPRGPGRSAWKTREDSRSCGRQSRRCRRSRESRGRSGSRGSRGRNRSCGSGDVSCSGGDSDCSCHSENRQRSRGGERQRRSRTNDAFSRAQAQVIDHMVLASYAFTESTRVSDAMGLLEKTHHMYLLSLCMARMRLWKGRWRTQSRARRWRTSGLKIFSLGAMW